MRKTVQNVIHHRLHLTLCVLFLILSSVVSARKPEKLKIIADTSNYWFVTGKIALGCQVTYNNNYERRTTGFLNGNFLWKNFIVTSDQGKFSGGTLLLNEGVLGNGGGKIVIRASLKGHPEVKHEITLFIPKVEAIAVLVSDVNDLKPGSTITPVISYRFSNGKEFANNPWKTELWLNKDSLLLYQNDELRSDGSIVIPEDILIAGNRITISALWKSNKRINDVEIFNINYDYTEIITFHSGEGNPGESGKSGSTNSNGYNGQTGGDGPDADTVRMYMHAGSDASVIYLTCVQGVINKKLQLKAGITKLKIEAEGGNGGVGGKGGTGGDAASGSGDNGGYGGNGGNGGNGGRGAVIIIYCDTIAEKYLPQLHINNLGGKGGEGGKGGKGGIVDYGDDNQSFFEVLFPTRNEKGVDGGYGFNGESGGDAIIYVVSTQEVLKRAPVIAPD